MTRTGIVIVMCTLVGCGRDPVDTCAPVSIGDLVVTEVQGDADELNGSWIELFNASGGTLDLEGVRIRFRRGDGSSEVPVFVRRSLSVGAGEYVVLGRYIDGDAPAHIDYGFSEDFESAWLDAAAIDVDECPTDPDPDVRIDLARYDALPDSGTYSFGGTPDAVTNDIATMWCFDATPTGTPGAANTPCP